jgi:hypothetical protein
MPSDGKSFRLISEYLYNFMSSRRRKHDNEDDKEVLITVLPKRCRETDHTSPVDDTTPPSCSSPPPLLPSCTDTEPGKPKIEFTDEHKLALKYFEEGKNILITGPAGTGKTTLLKEIIERCGDAVLLQTGPTGVSALQLPQGKTLHSALKIPVGTYPSRKDLELYYLKLWQKHHRLTSPKGNNEWFWKLTHSNVMIIDETSMVSVYMVDVLDIALGILRECRDKPMGGMQIIFVGDFMQHPPVYVRKDKSVPPEQGKMAFKSPVWTSLDVKTILLTRIFRQQNSEFAELLNTIRKGETLKGTQLLKFNTLLDRKHTYPGHPLYICHKRDDVSHINKTQLDRLKQSGAERHQYKFPYMVSSKYKEEEEDMTKMIRENLNMGYDSTCQLLVTDMRVMLVRNSTLIPYSKKKTNSFETCIETKLVNGDTGTIIGFDFPPPPVEVPDGEKQSMARNAINALHARYQGKGFDTTAFPLIRFDRFPHKIFQVLPTSWGRQQINSEDGEMVIRVEIDAIPLIAAWAITSHRCQGSTIADIPVTINADCMQFCEGSFYVAFSRCKQFEQLSIINYKGYCQSKEAYGFYQGFLTLPSPRKYQIASNLEEIQRRLQSSSDQSAKQPCQPSQPSQPSQPPKSSQPISSQQTAIVEPCLAPSVSSAKQFIQEKIREGTTQGDAKKHWDLWMVPQLDQFCTHYESEKKYIIELINNWVKTQKKPPPQVKQTQSTLNIFLKRLDDSEFI